MSTEHSVAEEDASDTTQMVDVGLLVLGGRSAAPRIGQLLKTYASRVRQRLYVRVHPSTDLLEVVPLVYLNASQVCGNLDVRVLLAGDATKRPSRVQA